MRTTVINDEAGRRWVINHHSDLSGPVFIQHPDAGPDDPDIEIPGDIILELVGQFLDMEVVADLEDLSGQRFMRALKRMATAASKVSP